MLIHVFLMQVPETQRWANLFAVLEEARAALNMEDYSISQTTLEQIFLDFAAEQNDEAKKMKKKQANRGNQGGNVYAAGARGAGLQTVTTRV